MAIIGIDTGGTFCDLVHLDDTGRARVHKASSTPANPAQGVFDVLNSLNADRVDAGDVFAEIDAIAIGTTIATNAVVTRAGSKVGLFTTRGHGDMLTIMRVQGRVAGRPLQDMQNYAATNKPAPIVPKALITEIDERIDYTGDVVVALDEAQVTREIDRLVEAGIEALAVSFLWGFLNADHELRVKAIANDRHPNLFVSLGSALASKLGEYERTEAAVLNAYVARPVRRYLDTIGAGLKDKGVEAPLLVMHSAGGVATETHSKNKPITTLFSGPAGGIVASMRVAQAVGFDNVVCADVGGTTFDVGLIVDGRPLLRSTSIIDQRVMYCPTIDLVSIGAGGGSIARVDPATRRVLVGPDSAGAAPGPACYGRGGTYPTVTDANLVLGFMDPDRFLGGKFKLDRQAAVDALQRHVAGPLGIDVEQAAAAIFAIVNAKMADLVRKITVERGHDPRDFALCAYGGLGPLHAPFYAGDLHVKALIIPLGELSSVFSAFGIATADILHVRELSTHLLETSAPALDGLFERLAAEADAQLDADGIIPSDREMRRFIEVRYVGQLNGMSLPLHASGVSGAAIRQEYERLYTEAFGPGAAWADAPIEIVGLRLEAMGKRKKATIARCDPTCILPEPSATRPVFWPQSNAYEPTVVLPCSVVGPDWVVAGPAILEFTTTTITVPPGWTCRSDTIGNLLLSLDAATENGR